MAIIGVRSPRLVVIDESDQTASKVELYIWNGNTSTAPSSPQYTLSKFIPATNNTETVYNISPYIAEYMTFNEFIPINSGAIDSAYIRQWCQARVKRYKIVSGVETLLDSTDYYCVYSYGQYNEQYNGSSPTYLLKEGTYYYYYNEDTTIGYPGSIFAYLPSGWKVKYTTLESGYSTSVTVTNGTTGIRQFIACHEDFWSVGNKVEVLNASNVVQQTWYQRPTTECYYTPLAVDFINRYGAWQRTFMYKASKTTLDISSSEFNKMPSSYNYLVTEPQRKTYNVIGTEKIIVNTGWVDETYNENTLKQLMLSETILIADKPAKLNTKSIEYKTQINNKNINYTMEFEYAYNVISDVI